MDLEKHSSTVRSMPASSCRCVPTANKPSVHMLAPPGTSLRSTTIVERPSCAARAAAEAPQPPEPAMTMSAEYVAAGFSEASEEALAASGADAALSAFADSLARATEAPAAMTPAAPAAFRNVRRVETVDMKASWIVRL